MEGTRFKAPHTMRLTPVGVCIYCGTTEGPLTDEHTIPKGLGGTLVLPAASCGACATLTSQIERRVLRGFLDKGRQAMGIKGRKTHKRDLPMATTQAFIQADESVVEREIPVAESIRVMHLPVFTLPAFLDPHKPLDPAANGIDVMAIDTATFGPGPAEVVREHAAAGVKIEDRMDIWAFLRMLAKIAHGHHVSVHGIFPLHESPLVPLILGQRWDARNWIGNTERDPLPSDRPALHLLQDLPLESDNGSHGMAVRIKLFASHQSPTYALATRLQAPGVA